MLPKIYSNEYEVVFSPSEDYPVDVYVDLSDWTEEEATNYQEALDDKYTADANNVYTIGNSIYALIYYEEQTYGINIYADHNFVPSAPSAKDEINDDDLNAYFDFDLYATLPEMHSEDYEITDVSSVEYPIDLYIEFLDWHYPDAYHYDDALYEQFDIDTEHGYILEQGLFIYVSIDTESYDVPVYFVNIYSVAS